MLRWAAPRATDSAPATRYRAIVARISGSGVTARSPRYSNFFSMEVLSFMLTELIDPFGHLETRSGHLQSRGDHSPGGFRGPGFGGGTACSRVGLPPRRRRPDSRRGRRRRRRLAAVSHLRE